MATKTLKKKVQAKPAASKYTAPVVDSFRDIWLAGLGAFAVAQEESGKLFDEGSKLFDKFVAEGARFEDKTRDIAGDTVGEIREGMESTVDSVRKQATDQLDRLENVFGFSVADTLNRLGIPSTSDLGEVSIRMQKMSSQVNENWRGLNKAIDRRVKAALKKLDVPMPDDLNRLAERLQRFSRETVDNLVMLENEFEKRASGVLENMEIPTAEEFRKVSSGLQDVSGEFTRQWSKLEKELETRIKGILDGLGVPTRDEIKQLSESVAELATHIAVLEKPKAGTARKTTAGKKAAKKA